VSAFSSGAGAEVIAVVAAVLAVPGADLGAGPPLMLLQKPPLGELTLVNPVMRSLMAEEEVDGLA
jgi:hypothetical protein